MNILLDTHIILWSLVGDERLKDSHIKALSDRKNKLFISPISLYEILVLNKKKRIDLKTSDPARFIQDMIKNSPYIEAPITNDITILAFSLQLPQKDPADRLIVATALLNKFTLITYDRSILATSKKRSIELSLLS